MFRKKVIDSNLCCRSKATAEQQQQQIAITNRESRRARNFFIFLFFQRQFLFPEWLKGNEVGLIKKLPKLQSQKKIASLREKNSGLNEGQETFGGKLVHYEIF